MFYNDRLMRGVSSVADCTQNQLDRNDDGSASEFAQSTADRLKVTVKIAGLKPGRVVHVRSPRPFTSTSGSSLWSTEAWYTLNSLADGTTLSNPGTAAKWEGPWAAGYPVITAHDPEALADVVRRAIAPAAVGT